MSTLSPAAIESIGSLLRVCEVARLGLQVVKVDDRWEVHAIVGDDGDLIGVDTSLDAALAEAAPRLAEIATRVR